MFLKEVLRGRSLQRIFINLFCLALFFLPKQSKCQKSQTLFLAGSWHNYPSLLVFHTSYVVYNIRYLLRKIRTQLTAINYSFLSRTCRFENPPLKVLTSFGFKETSLEFYSNILFPVIHRSQLRKVEQILNSFTKFCNSDDVNATMESLGKLSPTEEAERRPVSFKMTDVLSCETYK